MFQNKERAILLPFLANRLTLSLVQEEEEAKREEEEVKEKEEDDEAV